MSGVNYITEERVRHRGAGVEECVSLQPEFCSLEATAATGLGVLLRGQPVHASHLSF